MWRRRYIRWLRREKRCKNGKDVVKEEEEMVKEEKGGGGAGRS